MDHLADITDGLRALGVPATPEQVGLLARHLEMVLEANQVLNLTRIPAEDAAGLHVVDSASVAPYVMGAPAGRVADLGSGAGYPGVPVAILTGRAVELVESVQKKAAFLQHVVELLCLKATVHPIRAEELAAVHREEYAAVTARALSALPSLVELAAPLLMRHGRLICMKGRPAPEEVARGDKVAAMCGLKRVVLDDLQVPGVDAARTMVVYERVQAPRVRLPRRNGLAQRQPMA